MAHCLLMRDRGIEGNSLTNTFGLKTESPQKVCVPIQDKEKLALAERVSIW